MKEYDVIVVGAGPAGCVAARYAAEEGAKVLLIERDKEIGIPVRCAEVVGEDGLTKFGTPDPRWTANELNRVKLFAPNGTEVEFRSDLKVYVLERRIFDRELAIKAARSGAEVLIDTPVIGLLADNGRIQGVKALHRDEELPIYAKVVLAADGLESKIGRWAGMDTRTTMHDIETCAQYMIVSPSIDPDFCEMHFGRTIAPGGYAWVFPKGAGVANVGLGIAGEFCVDGSPFEYLDRFVQRKYPDAVVVGKLAGGIPCSDNLNAMVIDSLMLIGDAAHQANPMTGGGIVNAMKAGRIAGRIAARSALDGDTSKKRLREYERDWERVVGRINRIFYRIKEYVFNMDDSELNRTADMIGTIEYEKRTMLAIFRTALIKQPKMLVEVARVFAML